MFVKKRKSVFVYIPVYKRKMCIEGFVCVSDAWREILVCVRATDVYKETFV